MSFYGYRKEFITEAEAISAVVGWTDQQFELEGVPVGTTSPTPVSFHLFTSTVLAAGLWEIAVTSLVNGSASSTTIATDFQVDGITRGGALKQTGISGGQFIQTGVLSEPFTAATHTFDFLFWKSSGTGTVTAIVNGIRIRRVA